MKRRTARLMSLLLSLFGASALLVLLANSVVGTGSPGDSEAFSFPVRLNEIMSANESYPDASGLLCDWIELINEADYPVDLSGYHLTDNNQKIRYTFPAGTKIAPGGYWIVCCKKNEGGAYADFSIAKAGGESIILMTARNVAVDSVVTQALSGDQTMARLPGGDWSVCAFGTPGFENSEAGLSAYQKQRRNASSPVVINELMAQNSAHPDADGRFFDWVEFYNASDAPVSLEGFRLSDRMDSEGYVFPAGTVLAARCFLTVYCDATGTIPGLAPFGISRDGGERLFLLDRGNGILDEVTVLPLGENQSYTRASDGAFSVCETPTPGYENTISGYEAYAASIRHAMNVSITEVMAANKTCIQDGDGDFSDWIELSNLGDSAADLSGCYLSDRADEPRLWPLPSIVLAPGEQIVVFCSGKDRAALAEPHASFALDAQGETVALYTPLGQRLSSLTFGTLADDQSACADASGAGIGLTHRATPGYPNTDEGFLAFQQSLTAAGPLALSEVMTGNSILLPQADGRYCDWIEIQNISDAAVNLSSFGIGSRADGLARQSFPDVQLAPGGLFLFFCTGEEPLPASGLAQLPLSLSAAEERLFLFDASGTRIDSMLLTGLSDNGSYGRMRGENGFFYFSSPTPGTDNRDGCRAVSDTPEASLSSGMYANGVLTVALVGAGEIRYTVDGALPTASSPLYTQPLALTKSTVLRAVSFEPEKLPSRAASYHYLIGVSHTVPVVSVSASPDDLFSEKTGISAPQNRYDRSVERPAYAILFEPDGSTAFSVNCGLKLHGASSRGKSADQKRSYKLLFRTRYGSKAPVTYPIFTGSPIRSFESILLRNGEDATHAFVRDEILSGIVCDMSGSPLLAQESCYCALYLNGEYAGLYALKETFSSAYYASHRGVSKTGVEVQRGYISDGTAFSELLDFAGTRNLAAESNYSYVESRVNLDSLIDWCIFEAYAGNPDVGVNVRYYRSPGEDGRWHYCLMDMDYAFTGKATFSYVLHSRWHGVLPRRLLYNDAFRQRFLKRFAYLLQNVLTPERVYSRYTALVAAVRPEIPAERQRWPRRDGNDWEAYLRALERNLKADRAAQLKASLASELHLSLAEVESYF